MNRVEFIGQTRIICFGYLKNMEKRIIVGDKITYILPYMVVVK